MPIVVADTSPLIYLGWVGHFDLLHRLYERVFIPKTVWDEVAGLGGNLPGSREVNSAATAGWLTIEVAPANEEVRRLAGERIDRGELEAISLAFQRRALLIVDDRDGRRIAVSLGIEVTGTIGVLARAKQDGLLAAIRPLIVRLKQETNFRFAHQLVNSVLTDAGELPI